MTTSEDPNLLHSVVHPALPSIESSGLSVSLPPAASSEGPETPEPIAYDQEAYLRERTSAHLLRLQAMVKEHGQLYTLRYLAGQMANRDNLRRWRAAKQGEAS